MKKQLLFILLALMPMIASADTVEIDGIWYNLTQGATNTAEVTSKLNGNYTGSVVIPNNVTYKDITYSVTSIGFKAFYECTSLTSITIPNSVTSIGNDAFYRCYGLASIILGNGITNIGAESFCGCTGLTSINIPKSVKSIGNYAFSDCSGLTSIIIPNSVTSLGNYAFSDCSGLTSIIIPNSVTSLGKFIFYNCSSLDSISIPNSLTSIGSNAFENCTALTSISIPESVTSIGSSAFKNCTALTTVTVNATTPPSVGNDVFGTFTDGIIFVPKESYSAYLTAWSTYSSKIRTILSEDDYTWESETGTLTLKSPNGIYAITDYISSCVHFIINDDVEVDIPRDAFNGNTSLQSISLGNKVTAIGGNAFSGCISLTTITINATNPPSIGYDVFGTLTDGKIFVPKESYSSYLHAWSSYYSKIRAILSEDDYTWESETGTLTVKSPYGIYAISDYNSTCEHFIVNDGVEVDIPESSFNGNTSLQSVSLGKGVKRIGAGAFKSCTSLQSISLGKSVTRIGGNAFNGCSSLNSFVIPYSVSEIGNYAFRDCVSLTSITLNATTPPSIGDDAFGTLTNGKIFVPKKSYNAYLTKWSSYSSNIRAILSEDDYTWESEIGTLTVKSPYGIYALRDYKSSCECFIVKDSVEVDIPDSAFSGNIALQSVLFGSGVTSIGGYAFSSCSGLTSITIPDGVTSIGSGAFSGCANLSTVLLNSNTITSKDYTSSSNLNHVFGSQVTSYTLGEDISAIGRYAFYQNTNISSITIPEAVTTIGEHAFDGCNGLNTISIGSSIEKIGEQAFANCKKIEKVYCYAVRYPETAENAFDKSYPDYIILYVPDESVKNYKAQLPWSTFKDVVGMKGSSGGDPCETPVITYQDGRINVVCATEGAQCVTTITANDSKTTYDVEIPLDLTYTVTSYATKAGYSTSETTTATLCWIETSPTPTDLEKIPAMPVLIKTHGGIITIEGASDGSEITVYDINGVEQGRGISQSGIATINTTLTTGSVAIVKIDGKSIKIVIK